MELTENDGVGESYRQQYLNRGRLLHKRSKTFHSLPSKSNKNSKSILREDSSEFEHVVRTRPSSCAAIESKPRLRTSSIPLLRRPKTVSLTGKYSTTEKDNFLVLGKEIYFGKNTKQNKEGKKEFHSSFTGRRRRTSSASNRSRNPSLGSATEALSSRSRSGSRTTLSRVPGLIKLNNSFDMRDFSEVEHDDDDEERRKKVRGSSIECYFFDYIV